MTWEVIHGDCLDVMRGMADASVDAVITDPPYGIGDAPIQGQGRTGKRTGAINTWHPPSEWDGVIDPFWCAECCRVSPVVVWFGHWRMRAEVERAMSHPIRAEIVWAKDCHVGPPCPVAMQDERIWVFGAAGIVTYEFATSVWHMPIIPTWAHRDHKNQKPLGVMAKAVRTFAARGATVFDPFCGSGSTGVACIREDRNFIGIEREAAYVEIARRRISDAAAQGSLFTGDAA